MPADVTTIASGKGREECPYCMAMIPSGNGQGKTRLLTRNNLDKRTRARKQFDAIAEGIAEDLGGEDRLSTVQRHLGRGIRWCCRSRARPQCAPAAR